MSFFEDLIGFAYVAVDETADELVVALVNKLKYVLVVFNDSTSNVNDTLVVIDWWTVKR